MIVGSVWKEQIMNLFESNCLKLNNAWVFTVIVFHLEVKKCLLGINSTKFAAGVNWHFFKLNLTTFCNRKLITLNYNWNWRRFVRGPNKFFAEIEKSKTSQVSKSSIDDSSDYALQKPNRSVIVKIIVSRQLSSYFPSIW